VLAIPPKRFDRVLTTYLTESEVDALLAACDPATWTGRRDHALLLLAAQTGLPISELIGLTRADLHLDSQLLPARHTLTGNDRPAAGSTNDPCFGAMWKLLPCTGSF
jgi:integrase